jgi:iron complex transport system ATP-binding protein
MTAMHVMEVSLTTGSTERVRSVSATLEPGTFTAIVGANGSGKSSLLNVMAGVLTPTSGLITIDNQRLVEFSSTQRARTIAWLGQSSPGADYFTVHDVVSWGRFAWRGTDRQEKVVTESIERLGLSELAHAPLATLSGGERLRTHIARVWAQDAPITFLDEPDASLDAPGRDLLHQLITDKVNRGHSVVAVTHDRQWAHSTTDHLWVMDAGRLTTQ